MSAPPDEGLYRARSEAYRLGLTPDQGEVLYRTGKTPQQIEQEKAQKQAEIQQDIESFKREKAAAEAQGGQLRSHEVRRTYDVAGTQIQTRTRAAIPHDPRSDIEIYKQLREDLKAEGKVLVDPPTIRRDPATGQVLEVKGRVTDRFSIGDFSLSYIDPESIRQARAKTQADQRFERMEGAADFATLTPKSGRPGTFEGVGPAGEFGRVTIGKTGDIISVRQDKAVPGGIERSLYEIEVPKTITTQVVKREPPAADDPLLGAANVAKNIATLYAAGFIQAFDPKQAFMWQVRKSTAPKIEREVEGELIYSGIESGKSLIEGKPTTEPFRETLKSFTEAPAYFTGSAIASAAIWLTPLGVSRLAGKVLGAGARAAPRARFDYEPLYGSFAQRESIRFTSFHPTRWENPEALAELAKFRMSIELPKTIKVAPAVTSSRTFEAAETVRRRDDFVITETRAGALVTEQRPAETIKSVAESITRPAPTLQAARTVTPSPVRVSQAWQGPRFSLGLGGVTGLERKRLRDAFSTQDQYLRYPGDITSKTISRQVLDIKLSTGRSERSALSELQKSLSQTVSRVGFKQDLGLRNELLSRSEIFSTTSLKIAQNQTTRQIMRQMTGTVTQSRITYRTGKTVMPFPMPFVGEQTRKKKKGRKRRVRSRKSEIGLVSPLSAVVGPQTDFGREIQKFTERYA